MAEVRTQPVKAQRFDNIDDVEKQAGAFEYFKSGDRYPAGMIYACPCGCGAKGALNFRPHPSPSWDLGRQRRSANPIAIGASRRALARRAEERHLGELLTCPETKCLPAPVLEAAGRGLLAFIARFG